MRFEEIYELFDFLQNSFDANNRVIVDAFGIYLYFDPELRFERNNRGQFYFDFVLFAFRYLFHIILKRKKAPSAALGSKRVAGVVSVVLLPGGCLHCRRSGNNRFLRRLDRMRNNAICFAVFRSVFLYRKCDNRRLDLDADKFSLAVPSNVYEENIRTKKAYSAIQMIK